MIYIGIDPGKSGGIAAINERGGVIGWRSMPENLKTLLFCIRDIGGGGPNRKCALEFVRSSPQMGVASSFTFGRGLGHLEMALIGVGIPYEEIHPVKWQNALDCRTRGDKNITKALASRLFPDITVTHANADALLLAEYLRRRDRGVGTLLETSANDKDSNNGKEESKGVEVKDPIRRRTEVLEEVTGACPGNQASEAAAAAARARRDRRAPHQAARSRVRRDR